MVLIATRQNIPLPLPPRKRPPPFSLSRGKFRTILIAGLNFVKGTLQGNSSETLQESNHSVTGGSEQTLLGPGGSGGTRRKHRPGQAGNQAPNSVSAKGGGRPWPPPRRNQRLGPKRAVRAPGPGHLSAECPSAIHNDRPPVTEGLQGNSSGNSSAEHKPGSPPSSAKLKKFCPPFHSHPHSP
jgi:hypothetical protein